MIQCHIEIVHILLIRTSVGSIYGDSLTDQSRRDGILSRQRIAPGGNDVSPGFFQGKRKISGLSFQMYGHYNGFAFKGIRIKTGFA